MIATVPKITEISTQLGPSDFIAFASLAFNVIAAIVALTWGLSRIKETVRDEIEENRTRHEADIDNLGRSFGETVTAIREKIREVELFGRDTYMRRDSFYKTMEILSSDMKTQFSRLDSRLERMEAKLDRD